MKHAKLYAIATQGILTIVVLLLIGYFIGTKIDKNSFWPGFLAAIGALCGVISFIGTLLKLIKEEEKKNESTSGPKD